MKMIVLYLSLLTACVGLCYSQQSIFVSAAGSDENSGRSEFLPYLTMAKALADVRLSGINRITILGALDARSESESGDDSVFTVSPPVRVNELLITGVRGASGPDRAVLAGRNSGLPVLGISGVTTRVRLEYIEIVDGEGEEGIGLLVLKDASVTLGPGAVIRDNQTGIKLSEGTCIIDGGEVRDNSAAGILVTDYCLLSMRGGSVRNNKGRGVVIQKGGRFSMTAGSVTGNHDSDFGAGVFVQSGGRFDQTAGNVEGNFSPQSPDVYKESGAFGNDLSMVVHRPPAPGGPSVDSPDPSGGLNYHIPFYISFYGQGWRENLFSIGVLLQLGMEIDFTKAFGIAVLGEAAGGLGYPYALEGNLLGVMEVNFAGKKIGFGGGYGINARTTYFDDIFTNSGMEISGDQEIYQSNFYRFALVFRLPVKTTFFAHHYDRGKWVALENWGFGIQMGRDLFK